MKDNTDRNSIIELIYAIQNMAHSEYHTVELMMLNKDDISEELKNAAEQMRSIRVELMQLLQQQFPNVGSLWCTFKHLFLTEMHLFELYEKDFDYKYIEEAQRVHLLIDDLLGIEGLENYKNCPRCDDDQII
jgi:hypothetical protein